MGRIFQRTSNIPGVILTGWLKLGEEIKERSYLSRKGKNVLKEYHDFDSVLLSIRRGEQLRSLTDDRVNNRTIPGP